MTVKPISKKKKKKKKKRKIHRIISFLLLFLSKRWRKIYQMYFVSITLEVPVTTAAEDSFFF